MNREQHGTELADSYGCHPDSAHPNAAGGLFLGVVVGLVIVTPLWLLVAWALEVLA